MTAESIQLNTFQSYVKHIAPLVTSIYRRRPTLVINEYLGLGSGPQQPVAVCPALWRLWCCCLSWVLEVVECSYLQPSWCSSMWWDLMTLDDDNKIFVLHSLKTYSTCQILSRGYLKLFIAFYVNEQWFKETKARVSSSTINVLRIWRRIDEWLGNEIRIGLMKVLNLSFQQLTFDRC